MLSREELENAFKEANHILDFLAQDLPHKKNQAEHLEHKLSPDEEVPMDSSKYPGDKFTF